MMSNKLILTLFMILLVAPTITYGGLPIKDKAYSTQSRKKSKKNRIKQSFPRPEHDPNKNANWSFGLGLGAIVLPLLAIPALALGITSLVKKEPNKTFATIGTVLGAFYTLITIILIIAFIFLI